MIHVDESFALKVYKNIQSTVSRIQLIVSAIQLAVPQGTTSCIADTVYRTLGYGKSYLRYGLSYPGVRQVVSLIQSVVSAIQLSPTCVKSPQYFRKGENTEGTWRKLWMLSITHKSFQSDKSIRFWGYAPIFGYKWPVFYQYLAPLVQVQSISQHQRC